LAPTSDVTTIDTNHIYHRRLASEEPNISTAPPMRLPIPK